MNGNQELSPVTLQPWWRDRAILVRIIGVIATIVVGLVTYWLAAGSDRTKVHDEVDDLEVFYDDPEFKKLLGA